jgi:hypothetical protein
LTHGFQTSAESRAVVTLAGIALFNNKVRLIKVRKEGQKERKREGKKERKKNVI